MSSIIVNQGLQVAGDRIAGINGPPAAYQSMAWDTGTGAGNTFLAAHTKINDRTATLIVASAMDATFPSRLSGALPASQTVSYQGTIAAGTGNGNTVGRISVHNIAAGSVTASSATLCVGIDQQSIAKTADFALTTRVDVLYTSV